MLLTSMVYMKTYYTKYEIQNKQTISVSLDIHQISKSSIVSDTPSSGDYKCFNDLYGGSFGPPLETHLYSEIPGMRDCTYPDLVQDYVHLPFDTTLHRTKKLLEESIEEEENIEPYSCTSFWDQSIDSASR